MKIIFYFLLVLAFPSFADTPVDDVHVDAKTGKVERRTITVHDRPLTVQEGMALDAKRMAQEQAQSAARAKVRAELLAWSKNPPATGQDQASAIAEISKQLLELMPAEQN